jgi:hypothetical protein
MAGGYSWLTREVWNETYRRAYLYARKLRHPPHEAEDFAQAAMAAALDPEKSPWVPLGAVDFASHVCNLLYSAHGNHVQSYGVLHANVPLTDEALGAQVDHGAPDATLARNHEQELARARYEALLERTKDDALVSRLLEDDEEDGHDTSTERALAAGHTLDEIKFARQRLKRHIEAVLRQMPGPHDGKKGGKP